MKELSVGTGQWMSLLSPLETLREYYLKAHSPHPPSCSRRSKSSLLLASAVLKWAPGNHINLYKKQPPGQIGPWEGFANDSIEVAINGGHKYTPDEVGKELEKIGYEGCDFTVPISLKEFNSDITWYLCKAYK